MCACGHGALCFRPRAPQCGTCQELCLLLAEDSPARGLEALTGQGGLCLNKKGQQSSDVITGTGENSHLVSNWDETGLHRCQRVAFAAVCILHVMSVAAGVCLGTCTPPKVFLAVSFPATWQCAGSSLPCWWGAPGFCKPRKLSPVTFSGERYYVAIIKMSRDVFIHKCRRKGK